MHLKSFLARLDRKFGKRSLVWVRHFHERGAPHFHVLAGLPETIDGETSDSVVGQLWSASIGTDDSLHRVHGSHIAWFEPTADKAIDVIAYMAGLSSLSDSEYQFRVPRQWEASSTSGKSWGHRRLPREVSSVEVRQDEAYEVMRILRRYDKSKRRTRALRVARTNRRTGRVRYRTVRRRAKNKSVAHGGYKGGTQVVPDGYTFWHDVRRYLEQHNKGTPGQCAEVEGKGI